VGQDEAPVLGPADVEAFVARLGPLADELVLIGGQAVNLWAERYADRAPELAASAPHTSKDIDFYGNAEHVRRSAQALGGRAEIYGPKDRTVCAGVIHYDGASSIDVVHTPCGVNPREIVDFSIRVGSVRVLHPIHCLESRAANVDELGREDALALKQLRAAVVVVREFMRDLLEQKKQRDVLRLCERVFVLAISERGRTLFRKHNVDVFEAVLVDDDRLPSGFRDIRYPQMLNALSRPRR
jgi:hypothetical protein